MTVQKWRNTKSSEKISRFLVNRKNHPLIKDETLKIADTASWCTKQSRFVWDDHFLKAIYYYSVLIYNIIFFNKLCPFSICIYIDWISSGRFIRNMANTFISLDWSTLRKMRKLQLENAAKSKRNEGHYFRKNGIFIMGVQIYALKHVLKLTAKYIYSPQKTNAHN